jgi:U3 small nucleolar RNA-associated protein 21
VFKLYEGPQLPKKIRALASYREYTFAAYGNEIAVFKRAHQVCAYRLFVLVVLQFFY